MKPEHEDTPQSLAYEKDMSATVSERRLLWALIEALRKGDCEKALGLAHKRLVLLIEGSRTFRGKE